VNFKTYVAGTTPIPYDFTFQSWCTATIIKSPAPIFLKGQVPYITVNQETKEIIVIPNMKLNAFLRLDLKVEILLNQLMKKHTTDNIYDMISDSQKMERK
jgi:hypothetical protein